MRPCTNPKHPAATGLPPWSEGLAKKLDSLPAMAHELADISVVTALRVGENMTVMFAKQCQGLVFVKAELPGKGKNFARTFIDARFIEHTIIPQPVGKGGGGIVKMTLD